MADINCDIALTDDESLPALSAAMYGSARIVTNLQPLTAVMKGPPHIFAELPSLNVLIQSTAPVRNNMYGLLPSLKSTLYGGAIAVVGLPALEAILDGNVSNMTSLSVQLSALESCVRGGANLSNAELPSLSSIVSINVDSHDEIICTLKRLRSTVNVRVDLMTNIEATLQSLSVTIASGVAVETENESHSIMIATLQKLQSTIEQLEVNGVMVVADLPGLDSVLHVGTEVDPVLNVTLPSLDVTLKQFPEYSDEALQFTRTC